jgi:hypothetical protein
MKMKLNNRIVAWAMSLTLAAPVFAGSVTITNKTNLDVEVESFDWDDGLATDPSDEKYLAKDATVTLSCRKSWWVSDSPGCYVRISGGAGSKDFGRKDNGSYDLTGNNGDNYQLTKPYGSDVSAGPMALPKPGGGTTDCLTAVPGGTILDNGNLHLLWQNDGNLVLYRNDGGGPVWGSGTDGKANQLCFQGDGNLVMYNGSTATPAVWATRTDGRGARP